MKQKRYRPDQSGNQKQQFQRSRKSLQLEQAPCALCGLPINYDLKYPNPWSFTADHIIPVIRGGKSGKDNIQAAHFRCNRLKGTRMQLTVREINMLRLEQGCRELLPEPVDPEPVPSRSRSIFARSDTREPIGNDVLPWSMDWTAYRSDG